MTHPSNEEERNVKRVLVNTNNVAICRLGDLMRRTDLVMLDVVEQSVVRRPESRKFYADPVCECFT